MVVDGSRPSPRKTCANSDQVRYLGLSMTEYTVGLMQMQKPLLVVSLRVV